MKLSLFSFQLATGLAMNLHKTKAVYIRKDEQKKQTVIYPAMSDGCDVDKLPSNPYIRQMPSKKRMGRTHWENSKEDRLTLLNSTLTQIPTYIFHRCRDWAARRIKRIRKDFYGDGWGLKRISLIKWERISRTKERGGLGVLNLRILGSF